MKECTKCHEIKPLSAFNKRSDRPCGVLSNCKDCGNKINKEWRLKNKDYLNQYYTDNVAEFRRRDAKWRSNNKESISISAKRWRELNPEKHRNYCRKWRLSNLDKDAMRAQDYRASKLKAKPKWENDTYIKLWYELAKIEEERTGKKVHVDHIVPLKGKLVCGLHCEDNMQLLFARDNIIKGNRYAY